MDNYTKYFIASILGSFILFLLGVFVGLGVAYFLGIHAIEVAGRSFKVENVNLTVTLNQSMIMDALETINRTRGLP